MVECGRHIGARPRMASQALEEALALPLSSRFSAVDYTITGAVFGRDVRRRRVAAFMRSLSIVNGTDMRTDVDTRREVNALVVTELCLAGPS